MLNSATREPKDDSHRPYCLSLGIQNKARQGNRSRRVRLIPTVSPLALDHVNRVNAASLRFPKDKTCSHFTWGKISHHQHWQRFLNERDLAESLQNYRLQAVCFPTSRLGHPPWYPPHSFCCLPAAQQPWDANCNCFQLQGTPLATRKA